MVLRNFICDATGTFCEVGQCKQGFCVLESSPTQQICISAQRLSQKVEKLRLSQEALQEVLLIRACRTIAERKVREAEKRQSKKLSFHSRLSHIAVIMRDERVIAKARESLHLQT